MMDSPEPEANVVENVDEDEDLMALLALWPTEQSSSQSESEASSSASSNDLLAIFQPQAALEEDNFNKCDVCGEKAGKHNYYGGRACPSCRYILCSISDLDFNPLSNQNKRHSMLSELVTLAEHDTVWL